MPVHIKEINIQNLGPITQFSLELGIFNLIYGRNEKGKTYLVEFMIRSLFRNPRLWQLREQIGRGKVTVEGLTNAPIDFYPASSKKLEDFWGQTQTGLPHDFSKLLVVKGAEVEIANVDGGADKAILKRYLSSKEILDNIENRISKTLQESKIENNLIIGPKRGEISTRENLEKNLTKIDNLFEQLDKGYSGGQRTILEEEKQQIQELISQQLHAKRFLAFKINQEIQHLHDAKSHIAIEKLQAVRDNLTLYKQKIAEYRKKQETQKQAENRSRHYEWLRNAHEVYQHFLKEEIRGPRPIFLILALIMVILAGLLTFLRLPYPAALALASVILFGFLYIRKIRVQARRVAENEEVAKLQGEFKSRFQQELTGLPLILETLHQMEEDYNTGRLLKKQLMADSDELNSLRLKISELIKELTGQQKEPETWDQVLRDLDSRFRNLESKIREKELYQAQLAVDPSDYKSEPSEIEYSKQQLDALEEKLKQIQGQIDDETRKLASLKQLICQQTGDTISVNWETLINNLRERREAILKDYKLRTAEVIGKIAVHEIVQELRKAEDTKILAGLKSKEVEQPLFQLTNRYQSLDLDGEKLVVSDPFDNFYLSELSTGAQEQVLLALRIGFSTRIMGKDSMFLILDDAFQYSDYERRKFLTNKVVEL
ncbi:MAG: ATP-binding protein, partial [bacterium]